MRISDINKVKESAKAKKKNNSKAVFKLNSVVSNSVDSVNVNNNISAIAKLDTLILAKDLPVDSVDYANNLLGYLEELRDGIVFNNFDKNSLDYIKNFLADNKLLFTKDEKLNAIIKEIKLRLKVELAKISF